ncbi:MAG: hypothetical protein LBE83_01500 [Propionibacteriaceae bacterium]|jgi:uncharacterized protein YukE|nr:hypothetical protein [Propionibacteriaceae bacterium]
MARETWFVDTDQIGVMRERFKAMAETANASMNGVVREVDELVTTSWQSEAGGKFEEEIKSWQLCGQALVARLYKLSAALTDIQGYYVKANQEVQEIWREK